MEELTTKKQGGDGYPKVVMAPGTGLISQIGLLASRLTSTKRNPLHLVFARSKGWFSKNDRVVNSPTLPTE